MLQYWDTCINVDEDTDIDLPLLVTLDEESIAVTTDEFKTVVNCDMEEFLSHYQITTAAFCVYPSLENCKYAFIYDIEKDIHYLFY